MPSAKGSSRASRRAERERSSGKDDRAPKKGLSGWAAVHAKQKEFEERSDASNDSPRDFWLKSGEMAIIQILDDEPYTFDGHSVRNKQGKFRFEPCQKAKQKYCLMCRDGLKQGWKAAFKVLDFRGDWDKDKKKFKWNKPVEKIWVVNMTILGQLATLKERRKRELTELVLEVSRTGKGKNDTAYNFEKAFDPTTEEPMKPVKHKMEFPATSECVSPKEDAELVDIGFEAPDNEEDD